MHKIFSKLLNSLFVVSVVICFAIPAFATDYHDISQDHWAKDAIQYWSEVGVIDGLPDGSFGPELDITRAEVAKVLSLALDLPLKPNSPTFMDVPEDHWAYHHISACAASGILIGDGSGNFYPTTPITRQEIMTALDRVTTFTCAEPTEALSRFGDYEAVADWAFNSVATLVENGIISGYEDGTLDPTGKLTRSEFIAIMYRIELADSWSNLYPADTTLGQISWSSSSSSGAVVNTQLINGLEYLLLPSSSDLTHLTLEHQGSVDAFITIKGDLSESHETTFDLTQIATPDNHGIYTVAVVSTLGKNTIERQIRILRSEHIMSMFLTSDDAINEGRDYIEVNKENKTTGSMTLITDSGDVVYDNSLSQIKCRGNSTFWLYQKKSYQIKLDKKTDLLNNGEKIKTWVLLANYADASLFHDKSCKDLAAEMNMPGAPDCDWVDLYYDGEYRGVYLLSEKVDTGSTGIDIRDLEGDYEDVNENYGDDMVTLTSENRFGNSVYYTADLVDPEDISDGYLIEMNSHVGDEACWFKTTRGYAFNIKTPEYLSLDAALHISEYYQEFETAIYARDSEGNYTGINPETNKYYYEYCDLTSLVQMYLIYQFSHNQDAYGQSTYFYLTEGMLYAGPIWDSDQAYGVGWNAEVPANTEMRLTYLVAPLQKLPSFQAAVKEYYETTFRPLVIDHATTTIYRYKDRLSGAEAMNHVLWPSYYRWSGLGKLYPSGTTYSEIIQSKETWMLDRIDYLDSKFASW